MNEQFKPNALISFGSTSQKNQPCEVKASETSGQVFLTIYTPERDREKSTFIALGTGAALNIIQQLSAALEEGFRAGRSDGGIEQLALLLNQKRLAEEAGEPWPPKKSQN